MKYKILWKFSLTQKLWKHIVNSLLDLEPKMEGDETALKETMSECLNDGNNEKLDTSMVNENVHENENNHTIFHNISYLGATRMDEPKNERLIQGNFEFLT